MVDSLSIIHIEDEYREFLSLSTTVKTMIEDYWRLSRKKDVIAERKKLAESDDVPQSWIIYEIIVSEEPEQRFRYIYVKDAELPKEVLKFFVGRRAFILDVLRPVEGGTTLGISVDKSLESIRAHLKENGSVVLFTAHQGSGLDSFCASVPRKISKESSFELEEYLAELVERSFLNG